MNNAPLQFVKYQGLGNDFLVVDLRSHTPCPHPEQLDPARGFFLAKAVCDRRLGVGGDGVLTLHPPQSMGAAATMRVLNADGSEAEMCGNGLRCVVKFLLELDLKTKANSIVVDTGAGPLSCQATWEGNSVASVTVDMGPPGLLRGLIPMTGNPKETYLEVPSEINGRGLTLSAVSMGNPHAITFVPETGDSLMALAKTLGPSLETRGDFPKRCNAEFAHVHDRNHIELVVWERGVGITQACGTGACATVVAACKAGHCDLKSEVRVSLPGGDLWITALDKDTGVLMRGPAKQVFRGHVDLGRFLPQP